MCMRVCVSKLGLSDSWRCFRICRLWRHLWCSLGLSKNGSMHNEKSAEQGGEESEMPQKPPNEGSNDFPIVLVCSRQSTRPLGPFERPIAISNSRRWTTYVAMGA